MCVCESHSYSLTLRCPVASRTALPGTQQIVKACLWLCSPVSTQEWCCFPSPPAEFNLRITVLKVYTCALFRNLSGQWRSFSSSFKYVRVSPWVLFLFLLCVVSIFPQRTQENRGTLLFFPHPSLTPTPRCFNPRKWPRAQEKTMQLSGTVETACGF